MSTTRYCVGISMRGLSRYSDNELAACTSWISHDDGRPATVEDVRTWIENELAAGHEVYPFGCCDNWDWKLGCRGHPVVAEPPAKSQPLVSLGQGDYTREIHEVDLRA